MMTMSATVAITAPLALLFFFRFRFPEEDVRLPEFR
jgi:hypothetical protein